MKRGRDSRWKIGKIAASIRFVWLVCIVAGIGYLITQRSQFVVRSDPRRPTLALRNDSSVTVLFSTGSSTRFTREEFERRFGIETHSIEGANAANGSVVFYGRNVRSPDRNRIVILGTPKRDGASVIEISSPPANSPSRGEGVLTLVLRWNSRPLRDARVHGWSDPEHLLVSAFVTSTRAIFNVELTGAVRELARLPDAIFSLEARRGAIWYITASPGEGIESEPVPPSELHRISPVDGDRLIARDEKRLILEAVPGPKGDVAIYFNDGTTELSGQNLGKRHPLLFLENGQLVMRDALDLVLVDPSSGDSTVLGKLPEGNVEVYEMNPVL